MSEQKPSICRMVVYIHPASADGKYPPTESPAVVQAVYKDEVNNKVCDLFVMSNTNGIFFAKAIQEGIDPSQWKWPSRT